MRTLICSGCKNDRHRQKTRREIIRRIGVLKNISPVQDRYWKRMVFLKQRSAEETDQYGNIVHVFSAYESKRTLTDEKPFMRGINSIQLWNDGKRWWVITIFGKVRTRKPRYRKSISNEKIKSKQAGFYFCFYKISYFIELIRLHIFRIGYFPINKFFCGHPGTSVAASHCNNSIKRSKLFNLSNDLACCVARSYPSSFIAAIAFGFTIPEGFEPAL